MVVSLSLQGIASLAHRYGIRDPQEAAEKLASFFISIGCDRVYDINLARHLALTEIQREYRDRKSSSTSGPVISSACPGWICYVEKTNGDLVIPYLSKVRSPQQIMGSLVKRNFLETRGLPRKNVFHVTVMPCFDKKLEASRSDFKSDLDGSAEVDCVLTPVEIEKILESEDVSLEEFDRRPLDVLLVTGCELDHPLTSHPGSESGGYAENLLISQLSEKLKCSPDDLVGSIEYTTCKNNDFIELKLEDSKIDNSLEKFEAPKFAIINGFRNIQTVVQRLKRKILKYDYIEVMACPSGCINGGAQSRSTRQDDQQSTVDEVKSLYHKVKPVKCSMFSDERAVMIYNKLGLNDDEIRQETLYTSFHSIAQLNNLNVSW